ncbi:MAG: hypothetical protein ACPL3B_06345, partial [Fervidobacterium sp.]
MKKYYKFKHIIIAILLLQFALNVSVYTDILVCRQFLGFICLTFVPGILLLRFFKLERLALADKVILTIGLSIAFLMFFGLIMNELLPMLSLLRPLSAWILIIGLNFVILSLCIIHFLIGKDNCFENFGANLRLSKLNFFAIVVFVCVPVLSIFATEFMNNSGDNSLLLILFGVIVILTLFAVFSNKILNFDVFPVVLLTLYASILFTTWLATNYVVGYDGHLELYSFKITNSVFFWNPVNVYFVEIDKGTSMLSVTILPTIYSQIMNLDPT